MATRFGSWSDELQRRHRKQHPDGGRGADTFAFDFSASPATIKSYGLENVDILRFTGYSYGKALLTS